MLPIIFSFNPPKSLAFLPDLIRYLRQEQPGVLLAAKTHTNLVALWATQLAKTSNRVVISERTTLSEITETSHKWRWRFILPVLAHEYPKAEELLRYLMVSTRNWPFIPVSRLKILPPSITPS